jgi:hypothetical protein
MQRAAFIKRPLNVYIEYTEYDLMISAITVSYIKKNASPIEKI